MDGVWLYEKSSVQSSNWLKSWPVRPIQSMPEEVSLSNPTTDLPVSSGEGSKKKFQLNPREV